MATALLQAKARASGDALDVESAGTHGVDGHPASFLTRHVLGTRGLEANGHVARTVTREMLAAADIVLVMTREHREALRAEFPDLRSKLHLMSELVGQHYDIADPYGRFAAEYEICAQELEQLIQRGYPQLKQWLAPSMSHLAND
jgi:protein-tyrosine-phosphatase